MEHRHEASYRYPMIMSNGIERGTCVCGTPVTRPIGTGVTPAANDAPWVASEAETNPLPTLQLGDRVTVVSDLSEHVGVQGFLSCVEYGNAYYVATTDGDMLLGPFTRGELSEVVLCGWFLTCPNEATATAEDTTWGPVPVCGPCLKFANPDKALY